MKIFKNWFSKQDKKSSQANVLITLGVDENDDNFFTIEFNPGYEDRVAELLYLFNSGMLFMDSIGILREACQDDEKVLQIMQKFDEMNNKYSHQNVSTEDQPMVDPCEVFHKRDDNEFKG